MCQRRAGRRGLLHVVEALIGRVVGVKGIRIVHGGLRCNWWRLWDRSGGSATQKGFLGRWASAGRSVFVFEQLFYGECFIFLLQLLETNGEGCLCALCFGRCCKRGSCGGEDSHSRSAIEAPRDQHDMALDATEVHRRYPCNVPQPKLAISIPTYDTHGTKLWHFVPFRTGSRQRSGQGTQIKHATSVIQACRH